MNLPELKNCFRCGTEFRTHRTDLVCSACRQPQTRVRPIRNELSFRERQIVGLVTKAKLNKEIAYELHLSEGTIKEYLNRVFRKLGVKNRTELAIWAIARQETAA